MDKNHFVVEYIWNGGNNEFRSKVRCLYLDKKEITLDDVPMWNYDGSSTNQVSVENSEITLKPVKLYSHKKDKNAKYYVLCETYKYTNNVLIPLANNYRNKYTLLQEKYGTRLEDLDCWFGFEQEFFIFDLQSNEYLGFSQHVPPQGPYYCNVESVINCNYKNYKSISEMHEYTELIFNSCLEYGVHTTGWNLEVAPAQTEIQIFGKNINACDDLIFLRFLSHQVLRDYSLMPIYHPKPLGRKWNGSGLHTNVSTSETRQENGYSSILEYMNKFSNKHQEHLKEYGDLNYLRLTGEHETSSMDYFNFEVGSRATSVRIPRETAENKKGYFEDRRPASNADPYRVATRIIETILE